MSEQSELLQELKKAAQELLDAQAFYDEVDSPGSYRLARLEDARENLKLLLKECL